MKRAEFISALTAVGMVSAHPSPLAAAAAVVSPNTDERVNSALILSGGGARGAYQAGIIEALHRNAGGAARLPGVDIVCGTSIGALNGWFLATGRFMELAEVWRTLGSAHIFELKPRYRAAAIESSGLINKIAAAVGLAKGITKDVRGVLDGAVVEEWIRRNIDVTAPLLIPYTITVTNLDRRRIEIFAGSPRATPPAVAARVRARLRLTAGPSTIVRSIDEVPLVQILRASTSIPLLFDPVLLRSPEGTLDAYVDGGVVDNNPIDAARALARSLFTVFVDAELPTRAALRNGLEITIAAFEAAQTRIIENSLWTAYLSGQRRRILEAGPMTAATRAVLAASPDAALYVKRPLHDLRVKGIDFYRQDLMNEAYAQGLRDAQTPFVAYAPPS